MFILIYHTTDGGLHWNKLAGHEQIAKGLNISGRTTGISLKDARNIWYTQSPFDVDMLDNTNGFFITATTDRYFLHTSDGGHGWQYVNYIIL